MTVKKALKVWHDSVGFNEVECGRDLQESITVAFRSLEAWENVKDEIELVTKFGNSYEPIEHGLLMSIIDKHLKEVSE